MEEQKQGRIGGGFDRFLTWAFLMFQCLDQLAGCYVRGWFFVWFNAEQPSPDETVSSWVGRGAVAGKRWALIAEKLIDLFWGAGHCRKAIGK